MILTSNSDRASDSVAIGGYQDKWAWMGLQHCNLWAQRFLAVVATKQHNLKALYFSEIKHEDIL